jgi:hypothetical protein
MGVNGSESEGYHISAASPTARSECDIALRREQEHLEVQSHATSCDTTPAESVVADCDPTPLLER